MDKKALLLIDLQNDFLPHGALAVPHGNAVLKVANQWLQKENFFSAIIATQDWHPKNHSSFTIWPEHCVQHTHGSELAKDLNKKAIDKIIYKGTDLKIDSYSAFFDNNKEKETELRAYLEQQQIKHLYIMGLATDYCVKYSVLDALQLGYSVTVISEGCRGINLQEGDVENAFAEMQRHGAVII